MYVKLFPYFIISCNTASLRFFLVAAFSIMCLTNSFLTCHAKWALLLLHYCCGLFYLLLLLYLLFTVAALLHYQNYIICLTSSSTYRATECRDSNGCAVEHHAIVASFCARSFPGLLILRARMQATNFFMQWVSEIPLFIEPSLICWRRISTNGSIQRLQREHTLSVQLLCIN